jgi:hypothetical protein
VQAALSPWSPPPTEPRLGYSTCQLEGGGGGGSQHSILGKLCHLHKYLKYFRYPPTICLSCTHVSFSRYFFPIYSGLPQGPYLDSRCSFSQIEFFRAAQEATPNWYCCYHGAFSLVTKYNNKQVPDYRRVYHRILGTSIRARLHKMESRRSF